MDTIQYEWDPAKAEINLRKHGIAFEDATFVFDDPWALSEPDRIEEGELRWLTIGLSGSAVLLVVHTVRIEDEVEIVRIISARRIGRKERKRYDEAREKNS